MDQVIVTVLESLLDLTLSSWFEMKLMVPMAVLRLGACATVWAAATLQGSIQAVEVLRIFLKKHAVI